MAKKLLCIVFLVVALTFVFTSCNQNNGNGNNSTESGNNSTESGNNDSGISSHTHSFSEWQTIKEATCTTEGSEERVCSCGKKEVASISKISHSFGEWQITKAATCTTDGSEKRVCACGESETRNIASSGHTEVIDAAVESDCYNYGLTEGSHCGTCGTTIIAQTEIEPSHDAPYGVCYECNTVTDGELAADTYVSIKSNALNTYFTTYYDGSMYVKYHFYDYDLDIMISNTYDGKIHIYVTLYLGAELIDYSWLYSGTGFVEYDVRMDGYSIEDGHTTVSNNAASIRWSTTLSSIRDVEFELYLSNYYLWS